MTYRINNHQPSFLKDGSYPAAAAHTLLNGKRNILLQDRGQCTSELMLNKIPQTNVTKVFIRDVTTDLRRLRSVTSRLSL